MENVNPALGGKHIFCASRPARGSRFSPNFACEWGSCLGSKELTLRGRFFLVASHLPGLLFRKKRRFFRVFRPKKIASHWKA